METFLASRWLTVFHSRWSNLGLRYSPPSPTIAPGGWLLEQPTAQEASSRNARGRARVGMGIVPIIPRFTARPAREACCASFVCRRRGALGVQPRIVIPQDVCDLRRRRGEIGAHRDLQVGQAALED